MRFQHINREDAEKIYISVKSVYTTASLAAGDVVCFDVATFDGLRVTNPLTANLNLIAGVASQTIANGDFGAVQAYGYADNVDVDGTSGLGAGDPLQVSNASFDLTLVTAGAEVGKGWLKPAFVAGEAYTAGAAADKKVFVRAL